MNYNKELKVARFAADKASKVLLKYSKNLQNLKQHSKTGSDFATDADLAAEKVIISTIKKHFPKHAFLSEEAGASGNESEFTWIIDPLDGTHNFSFGFPLWGTMIALQHKGENIAAVSTVPMLNEVCYAVKGKGAYMNGKKIHVSSRSNALTSNIYYSGMW